MVQKTVTRADLAEAVYEWLACRRTELAELVERFLDLIGDALVTGQNVKLSSFGSFQVRSKNQRIGRNPKTGEEVPILPRRAWLRVVERAEEPDPARSPRTARPRAANNPKSAERFWADGACMGDRSACARKLTFGLDPRVRSGSGKAFAPGLRSFG